MERYVSTCYPSYKWLCRAVKTLPLKARSLLIKACQAQTDFSSDDTTSPIATLIMQHPDVTYEDHGTWKVTPLIEFFPTLDITINDPLHSAIILDILRCSPLSDIECVAARQAGWVTEIGLAESPGRPSVCFYPFFFPSCKDTAIHESIPTNPRSLQRIQFRFSKFRDSIEGRWMYPRATHKNMSRSTRREFEETFDCDISSHPIFGQDDWQRVYHEHGVELGGVVEMRQKWYPSGAKPRTYFAMGGLTYAKSRFLQDFFTELVNAFPATNHITRLRPTRLRLSYDDGDQDTYRIYDLSSFTSNMTEQRSFAETLIEYFRGIQVTVVDECSGPLLCDLGMLLQEYYDTCVVHPLVSYERTGIEGLVDLPPREHARASMLGIFGNLMTCTLAHYLIVSPAVDEEDEINIAGDDGLVRETLLNRYMLDAAIGMVGDCAKDKTMQTSDFGAVCLKRPISEDRPTLHLSTNFVPPNLATTLSYLLGREFDPRYEFHGLEEIPLEDRLTIVGKDLMRFLTSAYDGGLHSVDASRVFGGFRNLVASAIGVVPRAGHLAKTNYVWPLDPSSYVFESVPPVVAYARACCQDLVFNKREVEDIDIWDLRYAGDVATGNSTRRLVLLERLGYLEKRPTTLFLEGQEAVEYWLFLQSKAPIPPVLYEYSCTKDIPLQFLFEET